MTKMLATMLAATLVSAGAAFAAPAAKAPVNPYAPGAVKAATHAGTGAKGVEAKPVAGKIKVKYVGHLKKLPRHGAHKQPMAHK